MNITKRASVIAVVAAVGLGTPMALSPAQADLASERSAGCVTYAEYKRAKAGMTVKQVAKLFGTRGKQASKSSSFGITVEIRNYNGCTQFGVVSVLYTNGRLDTKSQAGL